MTNRRPTRTYRLHLLAQAILFALYAGDDYAGA
jgi:hypothetical protein